MNQTIFKAKIIPLMIGCFLWNIGFVILVGHNKELSNGRNYLIALLLSLIVNTIFLKLNVEILLARFKFLLKSTNVFLVAFMLLLGVHIPLFGLYIIFIAFQSTEAHSIKINRILILALLPILLITAAPAVLDYYNKNYISLPLDLVKGLAPTTESYSLDIYSKSNRVFEFKDNIINLCPVEASRPDCVLNWILNEHRKSVLSISEVILLVALDALEIFHFKNRIIKEKGDPSIAAKMLVNHNLELANVTCSRSTPLNNVGMPLTGMILGNVELLIYEMVEFAIQSKFLNVMSERVTDIATRTSAKLDMNLEIQKLDEFKKSVCFTGRLSFL